MQCLNCQTDTNNLKFCSRSCSGSYNNRIHIKRKKNPNICPSCGIIKNTKSSAKGKTTKYCKACRPNYGQDLTLQQAHYNQHGKWNQYTLVRTRARAVAKQYNMTSCTRCGYNKHVEICHIKAIHTFPDTTLVSVINDIKNLVALCPNCHWEFDHQKSEDKESNLSVPPALTG